MGTVLPGVCSCNYNFQDLGAIEWNYLCVKLEQLQLAGVSQAPAVE